MPTVTSRRKNAFVVQWSVMAGCIKFRMWSIFGIAELVSFSLLLDFFYGYNCKMDINALVIDGVRFFLRSHPIRYFVCLATNV